jgi:hypothetical protein
VSIVRPFPTDAPIRSESRQIGRGPAIDGLYKQVFEMRTHTFMFAPRRVGKTSMAWAVLDRIRDSGDGWAIEANLKRGITTSDGLAAHLAEQARSSGVRVSSTGAQLKARIGNAADGLSVAAKVAKLLGFDAADELTDAADVGETIDQALSTDEEHQDLRSVLSAIRAASVAADKPVVIFIDEAQLLSKGWSEPNDSLCTQGALAEVIEDPDLNVILLLTGSDRDGFEKLVAEGQPLHHDGMPFEVAQIDPYDWHHELPLRFAEVNLTVTPDRINQILEASHGHPQDTMRVCKHVQRLADREVYGVSDVLVAEAIAEAQKHWSWQG